MSRLISLGTAVATFAWLAVGASAAHVSLPEAGNFFVGTYTCLGTAAGFRIFIDVWPTEARVQFYSLQSGQCDGELQMTMTYAEVDNTTATLVLDPASSVWISQSSAACTAVGFDGNLSLPDLAYSGSVKNSAPCTDFSAALANGWGSSALCPTGYSQRDRVIFGCPTALGFQDQTRSAGMLAVEVPATQNTSAFQLPTGVTEVTLSSNFSQEISLYMRQGSESLTAAGGENASKTFGSATIDCVTMGLGEVLTCSMVGTLSMDLWVGFTNAGVDLVTVHVDYSYISTDCGALPSGCIFYDETEGFDASQAMLTGFRTTYGDFDTLQAALSQWWDQDAYAIPWTNWQSLWSWAMGSTSWAYAWGPAFSTLDHSGDGFISARELDNSFALEAGTCPAGYYRQRPLILNCVPHTGLQNISLSIPDVSNKLVLPLGMQGFTVGLHSPVQINLQLLEQDASGTNPTIIVGKTSGRITNGTGTYENLTIGFSGPDETAPHVESINATGTIGPKDLEVLFGYTISPGFVGTVRYSHGEITPCPSVPVGCAELEEELAQNAIEAWGREVQGKYLNSTRAWELLSDYVVFGWGLPWHNWNPAWRSTWIGSDKPLWSGSNGDFAPALRAFEVCDTTGDGYMSEAEFHACYNSSVFCPTGYYRDAYIIVGCTASSGTVALVVLPGQTTTLTKIHPGVMNFNVSLSSDSNIAGVIQLEVVSTGSECSSVSATEVQCAGSISATATLRVHSTSSESLELDAAYAYDSLPTCSGIPSGCQERNETILDGVVRSWSDAISGAYQTPDEAWRAIEAYRVPNNLYISPVYFRAVWCGNWWADNSTECENALAGFAGLDLDGDGYIALNEFSFGYLVSARGVFSDVDCTVANPQYTTSDFPMGPVASKAECKCRSRLLEGYSSTAKMCMKDTVTTCLDCPLQPSCASMHTIVGSGQRDFMGDCVLSGAVSGGCISAATAALSMPVSIALDESDNIYIADYGNNRVRRVDALTMEVVTLAGNGMVGFSGDGGPGRDAMLRFPEGVAVPRRCNESTATTVYFSDFLNQRVRKVTLQGSVWVISTVLGTGERGSNPACDAGCLASQAILNNPRSLAFDSSENLYIVDSGVRKIRRLSTAGIFSTLVGIGGVQQVWRDVYDGFFLSGFWSGANEHVGLSSINAVKVDAQDNLWYADSSNNRIFMTPLVEPAPFRSAGLLGIYVEHYKLHFTRGRTSEEARQMEVAMQQGFTLWLPSDDFAGISLSIETNFSSFEVGRSYWRFGSPVPGDSWCAVTSDVSRAEQCQDIYAQHAQFGGVMGMCFDAASDLFLMDHTASEIVKVSRDTTSQVLSTATLGIPTTTKDCRCLQYWVDWEDLGMTEILSHPLLSGMNPYELCRESPAVPQPSDPRFNETQFRSLPPCTVTNYCSDEAVPRCYINTSSYAPNHACAVTAVKWGYCHQQQTQDVRFSDGVEQVAIFGNEIRDYLGSGHQPSLIATIWSHIQSPEMELRAALPPAATSGATGDRYVPLWSRLRGFSEPFLPTSIVLTSFELMPFRPAGCSTECCGLNIVEVPKAHATRYCEVQSETDYAVLINWANEFDTEVQTIVTRIATEGQAGDAQMVERAQSWMRQLLIIRLVWWAPVMFKSQQDCAERCQLDPSCKAFVTMPNQDVQSLSAWQYYCAVFAETTPYTIYFVNNSVLTNHIAPYSRLFGDWEDAYTGDPHLISGPHQEAALSLIGCTEMCVQTTNCLSFGFPGCYLFDSASWRPQDPGGPNITMAFGKLDATYKVDAITGLPQVYAYGGDAGLAREALVNKPVACDVNSRGELVFADTWNQRIRKVTNLQSDCQYNTDIFEAAQIDDYVSKLNIIESKCGAVTQLASVWADMQYEVVQLRATKLLDDNLCKDPTVPTSVMTQNTVVLCRVCATIDFQGSCPQKAFCECRSAIRDTLETDVYKSCPRASAFHDKWHRFLTAYLRCYFDQGTEAVSESGLVRMLTGANLETLKNQLLGLPR